MVKRKKEIEYFPHLLKESSTIKTLENLYGNDGYAVWYKLLEILGKTEDYQYTAKTKEECIRLLGILNISADKFGKILKTLCDLNAIDKEMWKKERVIYVDNLVKNIAKMKTTTTINKKTNLIEDKKDKIRYLDYVMLSEEEYYKLIERYGESLTKSKIFDLNNYLGQNIKNLDKYTSHYHVILTWAKRDETKVQSNKNPQYKDLSNSNFD